MVTELNSSQAEKHLIELLRQYQDLFHRRQEETHLLLLERYSEQLNDAAIEIWNLTKPIMLRTARSYYVLFPEAVRSMFSGISKSIVEETALDLFGRFLFDLPSMQIDESRHVFGLIKVFIERRMLDQIRKHYRGRKIGGASSLDDTLFIGDEDATMAFDAVDDEEERIWLHKYIDSFCHKYLTPDEQIIMKGRFCDLPQTHAEIATILGGSWTEANVRKRYQRIVRRIKHDIQGSHYDDMRSSDERGDI